MKDQIETEWQFTSAGPPTRWLRRLELPAGFTLGPARTDDIADIYYDTEDWRVHRAGYALRLRRVGREREATLKQIADGRDGRHQRRELTELVEPTALRDGKHEARSALDHLEGPLAERINAVAGTHPVRAIIALHTRRRRQPIERDGRVIGELAFDVTSVPLEGVTVPARFHRVEIEVAPAIAPPRLEPFVEALRRGGALTPTHCSKLEEALRIRGLTPSAVADLGSCAIDDTMTTGAVALASLRRGFSALLEHEPGTRLGDDPEALHRMRVATRRLRATLALFAPALPARAGSLHAPLAWLADVLGAVRDVDVQLERLASWRKEMDPRDAQALEAIAAALRRRRVVARRRMLRALDSARYERFVARCSVLLRAAAPRRGAAREPIVATAPVWIRTRMRKVRRAGDAIGLTSPATAYHGLRIRCKKLRYALEAHVDVYGKPARRLVEAVVELQKLLGEHQDAEVASSDLRALCDRRGAGLSRQAIFVIGKIAARYEREAQRLRRRFVQRFRAATRRRWKRLRRAMAKRAVPRTDAPKAPRAKPVAAEAIAAREDTGGHVLATVSSAMVRRRGRRGTRQTGPGGEGRLKTPVVAG